MSETAPAAEQSPEHQPEENPGLGEHRDGPDRLIALSDGIFAIAMTLLVLNMEVPSGLDHAGFRQALHDNWPRLGAYALSFTLIAGRWRDHRHIFQLIRRTDATVVRLSLLFLAMIALLPFPTAMLASYGGHEALAVTYYATVVGVLNLLLLALFWTVWRRPALQARPLGRRAVRGTLVDFGATTVIAAAAIVVAFALNPTAGLLVWLAAFPAGLLARRVRGGESFSD